MSLLTQASPFNTVEGKPPEKMKSNMIDTFKRIQSEHLNTTSDVVVPARISKIEQNQVMESKPMLGSNDGDRLADFVIPPSYQSKPPADPRHAPVSYSKNNSNSNSNNGSSFSQSYGSTPYFAARDSPPMITSHSNPSNQLMEKLNYMIHLLEEQQKEPTQNIMEEFALYGLLGIFMIYIVDSFARVGKYTR